MGHIEKHVGSLCPEPKPISLKSRAVKEDLSLRTLLSQNTAQQHFESLFCNPITQRENLSGHLGLQVATVKLITDKQFMAQKNETTVLVLALLLTIGVLGLQKIQTLLLNAVN